MSKGEVEGSTENGGMEMYGTSVERPSEDSLPPLRL